LNHAIQCKFEQVDRLMNWLSVEKHIQGRRVLACVCYVNHVIWRDRVCIPTRQMTYVQNYVVARSLNHCCHENATVCSLFIFGADVAANSMKVFRIAMKMQQWNPFSLLTSYKIFRTDVNKNEVMYCIFQVCVCILALVIWRAHRIFSRHILLSVACLELPHFFHIVS